MAKIWGCRASVRYGVGTPLRYAPTHFAHSATRLKSLKVGKLKCLDPEPEWRRVGGDRYRPGKFRPVTTTICNCRVGLTHKAAFSCLSRSISVVALRRSWGLVLPSRVGFRPQLVLSFLSAPVVSLRPPRGLRFVPLASLFPFPALFYYNSINLKSDLLVTILYNSLYLLSAIAVWLRSRRSVPGLGRPRLS